MSRNEITTSAAREAGQQTFIAPHAGFLHAKYIVADGRITGFNANGAEVFMAKATESAAAQIKAAGYSKL